jgi:phosphopantetheinyl transferase
MVWLVDATSICTAWCEELLDEDEIQWADRLISEHDRQAFVATRAGLRSLLSSITGTKPSEFHFGLGAWGKPFVTDPILPNTN